MPEIIFYYAASLDGFIADREGGVSWLDPFAGNDHGYEAFIDNVDTLVYGRKTYEQELTFGPWSRTQRAIVVSRTLQSVATPKTEIYCGDVSALARRLRRESEKAIWIVGGGQLMGAFVACNEVDQIEVHVAPMYLGDGVRSLASLDTTVSYKFMESEKYSDGIIRLRYRSLRCS